MEFAFSTTGLRDICEDRNVAIGSVGKHAAVELSERLADMEAHSTVADFAALFYGEVFERSPSELALRMRAGYELVFCAGHVRVPETERGDTDWSRVTKIKILALEARHD